MASGDYICCKECGCKVIYDGYDTIRHRLEELWGDPDADKWTVDIIRCKPCFDKREADITSLRQRIKELEEENAKLKHTLRKIVDRVQGLQPIVLAAMQLDAAMGSTSPPRSDT